LLVEDDVGVNIIDHGMSKRSFSVVMDPFCGAPTVGTALTFDLEGDDGIDRKVRAHYLNILQFRRF
jgi:hypothetical protein